MISNMTINEPDLTQKNIPLEVSMFVVSYVHVYLELIIPLLGLIGFLGNIITFLQPELRSNTCCIYILCSSFIDIISLNLNVLPYYLNSIYSVPLLWQWSTILCKMSYFFFNFLPNLSINLMILSLIDRYACSCGLTSRIRFLNQLKMVPCMIFIVILLSTVSTLYGPILAYITDTGCNYTDVRVYGLFNIAINGVLQPIVMLLFTLLTYRNIRLSRQRTGAAVAANANRIRNQFILMSIVQVLGTAVLSLIFLGGQTYVFLTYDNLKTIEDLYTVLFFFTFTIAAYQMNNVKSFYFSMLTSKTYRKAFVNAWMKLFILLRRLLNFQ